MINISKDLDVPSDAADFLDSSPSNWINKILSDLFFLCTRVLTYGKSIEYQDLNWIHKELCTFINPINNPIQQLLVLMARDMLKSSVGRAMMIQWFLQRAYFRDYDNFQQFIESFRQSMPHDDFVKLVVYFNNTKSFIYSGVFDLAQDHLEKIIKEILTNQIIQAYFQKYIPQKKEDFDIRRLDEGRIRYGEIEIDIGSPEKSLAGHHYGLGMIDNLCNELNTQNVTMRKKTNKRWQELESNFAENSREVVFETTWAQDDTSGIILHPEGKFDYSKIRRKPCLRFISDTGYAVFSCPAAMGEGEIGTPVFPEKNDEEYLKRKRRKQGYYLYSRLYELQPMADEEVIIRPEWWNVHYERLPMPFIRNICVDAAGSTKKGSSYSGLSIGEWDAAGTLYLPCATKRKLSFKELEKWIVTEFDMSAEEGRPITWVGIEKEKFGMDLKAQIESYRSDIVIMLWDNRGIPREKRHEDLVPYYESRKILAGQGLADYEDELKTYYKGKDSNVDIIDTIWGHFQIRLLPTKPKFPTPYEATKSQLDKEVEEFEKQSEGDMRDRIRIPRGIALRF